MPEGAQASAAATDPSPAGDTVRTLLLGVPPHTRARLAELGGYEVVDDLAESEQADLVVVSTRVPRGDLRALLPSLRARHAGTLVVLVHTGGEGTAVDIVRAGATGVVGEGNEEALRALVSGSGHDTGLVDTYERRVTKSRGATDALRARDGVTGLPTRAAFDERLSDLGQAGEAPRVALLRLLHLGEDERGFPAPAELVRRRVAIQLRQLAARYGAELFTTGPAEFALLGADLTPERTEELGERITASIRIFAPSGQRALALALGHAGPEVTQEVGTLHELAQRALDVAAAEKDGAIVSADTLSLGVSSTTELEAAMRMVSYVEEHEPYPGGHSTRVAELAGELAWQLGYEGPARTRIQLAALLHDVGKVSLPHAALGDPRALDDELAEAYRSHPARGADYLRASAGEEVAGAVRAHHEWWDGSGFPDGLAAEAIPVSARIIAVADAVDRLRHPGEVPAGPHLVAEGLQALAGTRLDPELVAAAGRLLGLQLSDPQPA